MAMELQESNLKSKLKLNPKSCLKKDLETVLTGAVAFLLEFEELLACEQQSDRLEEIFKTYSYYINLNEKVFGEGSIQYHNIISFVIDKFNDIIDDRESMSSITLSFKKLFDNDLKIEVGGKLLYISCQDKPLSNDNCFLVHCVYDLMDKLNIYSGRLNRLKSKTMVLKEKILTTLSYPFFLVSSEGELLFHNMEFSKLNISLSKCLFMESGDKIELQGRVYNIIRSDFEFDNSSYYCIGLLSDVNGPKIRNVSSEDLGIISSSIAHELRNPLAGILASIAVLSLEDETLDKESLITVGNLNEDAIRCKHLVDIFLGLSKRRQTNNNLKSSYKESLTQALNLLRFRMIEFGSMLSLDLKEIDSMNNNDVNLSITSMIFYLVFSEVLTAYSHFSLITQKEVKRLVKGVVSKHDDIMTIRLDLDKSCIEIIEKKIEDSKLINHLLDLQMMKVVILDNFI